MLSANKKIFIGGVFATTLAWGFNKAYFMNTEYQKTYKINKEKTDRFFLDPNLDLLYSPLVFLYFYKMENNIENLFNYYDYIKFFKPKKFAFDITEEKYTKKYDKFVQSDDFLKIMKRLKKNLEKKEKEDILSKEIFLKNKFNSEDIIFLYTFYNCYTGKCLVYFTKDENEKKINKEYFLKSKIRKIKKNASPEVLALMKKKNNDNKNNFENFKKENIYLVSKMFKENDINKSFFEKPTDKTFFIIGKNKNINEMLKITKLKFPSYYGIDIFSIKDKTVTEEMEQEQLRKLKSKI